MIITVVTVIKTSVRLRPRSHSLAMQPNPSVRVLLVVFSTGTILPSTSPALHRPTGCLRQPGGGAPVDRAAGRSPDRGFGPRMVYRIPPGGYRLWPRDGYRQDDTADRLIWAVVGGCPACQGST